MKRYPIGVQTFEKIIKDNYLYVDKTDIIYNLTHNYSYAFLSRPRRFGKSLLVSTLKSYFEGRKELFEGLAVEKLEKDWIQHPVLHFDFSTAKLYDDNRLLSEFDFKLSEYEDLWQIQGNSQYPGQRLEILIKQAYKKTQQKVIVLIDEYDAPLLNVLDNQEKINKHREILRDFYTPLKNLDPYIRFVFITGITKFSQLSLFSELNNITNISMLPQYAAICGITEEELLSNFQEGIKEFAASKNISYEQCIKLLKDNYDGYHFTHPSPDIYNPFSILNAFASQKISNYWFQSGGTRLAIYALQKNNIEAKDLLKPFKASEDQFDKPFDRTDDYIALLYQSGYLTIKGCRNNLYSLAVPNKEVRDGLFKNLLPHYLNQSANRPLLLDIVDGLLEDDMETVFDTLKLIFKSVPQCDNTDYEGHYQSMLCIVFVLAGQYVESEVRTSDGRVDVVINNKKKVYLFEIKLNKSADAAIEQIENKDYAQKFILLGLPIVKVAVNFNTDTKNIEEWKVSSL